MESRWYPPGQVNTEDTVIEKVKLRSPLSQKMKELRTICDTRFRWPCNLKNIYYDRLILTSSNNYQNSQAVEE